MEHITNPIIGNGRIKRKDIPAHEKEKCSNLLPELDEGMEWGEEKSLGDMEHFQIIYKHRGTDFEKYIEDREYTFEEVLGHLIHFAEGIALFNHNEYSHVDIKAPNMLIKGCSILYFLLSILFSRMFNQKILIGNTP